MPHTSNQILKLILFVGLAFGVTSPLLAQVTVSTLQQKNGGGSGLLNDTELEGNRDIVVVVKFRLNRSGKIIGTPTVTGKGGDFVTRNKMKTRALRSVYRAQPFKLPQDKYDQWSQVTLTFYP